MSRGVHPFNLSSRKVTRVEQVIKATGAKLRYLPPYSPDMSPIEKADSKLNAFLHKIAERTVAGLMRALELSMSPSVKRQRERRAPPRRSSILKAPRPLK